MNDSSPKPSRGHADGASSRPALQTTRRQRLRDAVGAPHASAPAATPAATAALTVFYDGACPLCRREIDFYRRRPGAGLIEWLDVSACSDELVTAGLSRVDALARFHVRLADGRLLGGGLAFAELWCALPGWRWLGRIARARGIATVVELGYRGFLHLRPALQRLARRRDATACEQQRCGVERAR